MSRRGNPFDNAKAESLINGTPGDAGELQGWRMRSYCGEHPD